MARDGSGNYNLPAGQPVSTGTAISSTVHNTLASDVGSALTQSISKDGQTTPTANLPMGGFRHTGVADGTSGNHYATVGQLQTSAASLAASVAGTDTITATLNPAITTYTSGMFVSFIAANSNATTTPTIALNGLAAKTIVRPGGNALSAADMVATKLVHMQYDGTNFVLLNPATGTYPALIPTGSTVPANGMYLSAANTVAWSSNTTLRGSVNSTGNWVLAAPSSGTALAVAPFAGSTGIAVSGNSGSGSGLSLTNTSASDGRSVIDFTATRTSSKNYTLGIDPDGADSKNFSLRDVTRGAIPFSVSTTGNVTIAAPSSGTTLTVTPVAANYGISTGKLRTGDDVLATGANVVSTGTDPMWIGSIGAASSGLYTNSVQRIVVSSAGNVTINAPSSGTAFSVAGVAGAARIALWNGSYSEYQLAGVTYGYIGDRTGVIGSGAGMAIRAEGSLDLAAGGASPRVQINNTGNVTINAPSSGTTLAVNGIAGTTVQSFTDGTITARNNFASGVFQIGTFSAHGIDLFTGNTVRVQVSSAGNVTINTPSSGTALTVNNTANLVSNVVIAGSARGVRIGQSATINEVSGVDQTGSGSYQPIIVGGSTLGLHISGTNAVDINASRNVTINAPSSGVALAVAGVSGTHSATIADAAATSGFKVGFLGIPQNAQTANYTLVLADAGKHIYHAAGAGAGDTYTIPANASVAYDIGTTITFVNRDTTNAVSIAITTDTLTLAGSGSTGTRTLAAYGIATAIKVTSTEWMISGTGLT